MSISPPPPLPGGYAPGDKVFYTGQSFSFEYDGKTFDRVYGEQGEVTGPATVESHKGKGVTAVFSGDSRQCYLTQVRRLRAASAASPSPAAPHTRRCPHATCVPATASAAASQPSLHEQPLAPRPTAWVREGWWPRAWCWLAALGAAAEPYIPSYSLRLVAACAHR